MGTSVRVHTMTFGEGTRRTEGFEKKGLAKFSVNVGAKCGHGCLYCSTGATLRQLSVFKKVGENPFDMEYAIVDPDIPSKVAQNAKNARDRGLIQLCTTVDAWSPEAQEHNLGRRCLEAILPHPGWTVRILTKNAAVEKDFSFIKKYRDRVLVGLTLTATKAKSGIMSLIEPSASSISNRMRVLRKAHEKGFRTYGMLCPLLSGIANSPEQIDQLVEFLLKECGVEEIFCEPFNPRGKSARFTVDALRSAGYEAEADAVESVTHNEEWSTYCRSLLKSIQNSLRARKSLDKLRFLLYPSNLSETDKASIMSHSEGVKWL